MPAQEVANAINTYPTYPMITSICNSLNITHLISKWFQVKKKKEEGERERAKKKKKHQCAVGRCLLCQWAHTPPLLNSVWTLASPTSLNLLYSSFDALIWGKHNSVKEVWLQLS